MFSVRIGQPAEKQIIGHRWFILFGTGAKSFLAKTIWMNHVTVWKALLLSSGQKKALESLYLWKGCVCGSPALLNFDLVKFIMLPFIYWIYCLLSCYSEAIPRHWLAPKHASNYYFISDAKCKMIFQVNVTSQQENNDGT